MNNMRPSRAAVACGALTLLLAARPAVAQSRIAILDATGVSVLDTTTGQERARFPLELEPQETPKTIVASADGARLFITTAIPASGQAFLHVLDASTGERLARISTPRTTGKAGRAAGWLARLPGDLHRRPRGLGSEHRGSVVVHRPGLQLAGPGGLPEG